MINFSFNQLSLPYFAILSLIFLNISYIYSSIVRKEKHDFHWVSLHEMSHCPGLRFIVLHCFFSLSTCRVWFSLMSSIWLYYLSTPINLQVSKYFSFRESLKICCLIFLWVVCIYRWLCANGNAVLESFTWMFSLIRDSVTLLGITTTPRWVCHLQRHRSHANLKVLWQKWNFIVSKEYDLCLNTNKKSEGAEPGRFWIIQSLQTSNRLICFLNFSLSYYWPLLFFQCLVSEVQMTNNAIFYKV